MRPQYRFTLDGNKVISEPIGWNQMIVELNRDKKYWSLVESIELPLMFYGNSADGDGGYDYLKEARLNGPDSQVELLVEISWDFGVSFEIFFDGLLDFTELIDMETDRKFQCTTIRTSAWSRFINRGSVPVDVSAIATEQTLSLPSQEVRQLFVGIHADDISYSLSSAYGIIDWKTITRNEIKLKSNLPRVSSATVPVELFQMEFQGYYSFHGDVYIASAAFFPSNQITGMQVFIQINTDSAIAWTMEQLGTNGVDGRTHFYYHAQHLLQKGDQVRIYFFGTANFVWTDFFLQGLTVIADTIFPTTTAQSYFIHDVGRAILLDITGQEYFYSEYFGGINTEHIPYQVDGCGVYYRLLKGQHIRGASIAQKNFALSWDDLWEGLDPIFMLGAAYESVGELTNGDFTATLAPSFNSGAQVQSWAWNSDKARATLPNNFTTTKLLTMPFESIAGFIYTIEINFDILQGSGSFGASTRLLVYLSDGVTFSDTDEENGIHIGASQTVRLTITPSQNWPYLMIAGLAGDSSSFGRIIDLDSVSINTEVLRVEQREYFFDDSSNSIELEQYDMDFKLEISYDVDFLLTSIKHGYQKWQSQSASGNDDPQTQHTRATRFKTVGNLGAKDIEILSSFVAASLTIEQGRRLSEVLSQDWPLDEDTFIIQANSSLSPDEVRLYSNDVVTGIENADTRYNLRLTPVSNFNRWIRWLSIGFQNYVGDLFTFVEGQGNTDMVFDNPGATGCDAEPGTYADESGDIEVTESIMLPLVYKFSVPFTWENYKAVRDNRRKAIRLNYRNNEGIETTVLLFIRSLKYNPSKSEADFECWLKTIGQLIIDYEIGMQLKIDAALLAVTPRWDVDYITPETTETLSIQITVSTLEGDSAAFTGRSTVEAVVKKISNGGIAEGSSPGLINWVQNGNILHSVGFNPGNDVSENSYTFTNVLEGDILVAEIFEGLTS